MAQLTTPVHLHFPTAVSTNHMRWVTLTFRPYFHNYGFVRLLLRTYPVIIRNLVKIHSGMKEPYWKACPEITQKGVLHYHMLVKTINHVKLSKFFDYWTHAYGAVNIDKNVNDPVCLTIYMRKQTRDIRREFGIPICMSLVTPSLVKKALKHHRRLLTLHRQHKRAKVEKQLFNKYINNMLIIDEIEEDRLEAAQKAVHKIAKRRGDL